MSSVQHLRDFISERLTAAAEEIFGVFERTIVQYEEEMDRQRRLLDVTWKPQVHLDRTELLHHFLRKEEEDIPADQQLWNQERKSDLDQEEPDPPRIKEEHEDLCFIQAEEQQDANTSMATSAYQHISKHEAEPNENHLHLGNFSESQRQDPVGNCNEDSESRRNPELKPKKRLSRNRRQTGFWSSQDDDQSALTNETSYFMASGHEDRDPKNNPLIPLSFPAAEIRDQDESWKKGFGTKELKPKERRIKRRTSSNRVVERECLRPVSCDICGKTFRCNSDMKVHYRVHTGEKPFSCEICQRAFSFKVNLSVHMRTHTGEKPYSCKICEKRFSDHSSLRKHIYVHTGERPYSCAVCGKRFSRSSHRWRHVRLHATETQSS